MINLLIKWLALRPRVYLNLVLIVVTTMTILSVSFYSLTTAQRELEEHASFTSSIITDTQISDNIYRLHLAALNYTHTGNQSAAEKIDFYYESVRRKLFSSKVRITNSEATIRSLDSYYRGFNQLRVLREKRRRSTNIVLPEKERQIELALERLTESLYVSNNKLALSSSEALVIFMQAAGQSNAYFRRFEGQSLNRARLLQNDAISLLSDLKQSIKNNAHIEQVNAIISMLKDYRDIFNVTVEETRGYLYLVNVILAAEANEILYQADKRKEQVTDIIQEQRLEIDQRLFDLVSWVFIISLVALIIQFVISYLITLTITRPITTITSVFNELTQGSGKSRIPHYPQNDEIGDLTQAARTFKQKNIESRKVLNDYKELSEQLERRIQERTQELNNTNKDLEQAKREAEDMVQIRSDFIANVSHEIRTPINAVLGMTYLMRHTELNEQQADYIESINLSSKKLLAIINDILDFSKIEAGKLTIESTRLDLFQVICDSVNMLQTQAQAKGIEIYTHFDSYVGRYYYGDPLRLGQVITNLLNNAVKFTEQGYVGISIEAINIQRLRIKIHDTGIGINDDQQRQLFQAFTQADASTTRKFGGTGLGLVISKQLIEAMGGTIHVESEKSIGTTFTIELDMKRVTENIEEKTLQGKRVLLLEDDEISRKAFKHAMKHLGIDVVSTGKQQQNYPSNVDLILFAVQGAVDNTEDAEIVAQLAASLPETPICLLYPMNKSPAGNSAASKSAFLQKPLNPIKLVDVLNGLISLSEVFPDDNQNIAELRHELNTRAGSKVIVADDNLFNRQVVAGLLQSAKITIDEATQGEDLIAKVATAFEQQQPYEMVFLDYHMPVMNGLEACKQLRQRYPELPLVLLSGDVDSTTRKSFYQAGANAVLTKPINVKDFYEIVLSYLTTKQAYNETATASKAPDLPSFFNIDTRLGLRHSGGDTHLYRSLLKSFLQKYNDNIELFEQQFERGESDALAIDMHSLKGIAASIGAKKLAESAALMYQQPNHENLDDVTQHLFMVVSELKNIQTLEEENSRHVEFNNEEFKQALEKLLAAVKRRRPKQIKPNLSYIKTVKLPSELAVEIDHLAQLIDRFDYHDALKVLEKLLNDEDG